MGSTFTVMPSNRRSTPRMLLMAVAWAIILSAVVYFYLVAVSRYIHFDAAHYGHHWLSRWWLIAHLGGGSLALLLGPFQFSQAIRRRYVRVHRWMGRGYLFGVFIGSVAAVYISLYVTPIHAFGIAMLYLTLAWVTTSLMGFVAVMRRQFSVHREWMIRSYVVTFAFVTFRILRELHPFHNISAEADSATRGWFCWAVPLLFTEVFLQWRRTVGPKNESRRMIRPVTIP